MMIGEKETEKFLMLVNMDIFISTTEQIDYAIRIKIWDALEFLTIPMDEFKGMFNEVKQ